jgi:DNA-binding CsgD family transcriptional regulator
MFTEKELKMMSMKIKGQSNKEIAAELSVSEPDVSQTLARMRNKITSVKDSIELLSEIGILKEGPKLVLTEKGRQFKKEELEIKNHYQSRGCIVQTKTRIMVEELFPKQVIFSTLYGGFVVKNTTEYMTVDKKAYAEKALKTSVISG